MEPCLIAEKRPAQNLVTPGNVFQEPRAILQVQSVLYVGHVAHSIGHRVVTSVRFPVTF